MGKLNKLELDVTFTLDRKDVLHFMALQRENYRNRFSTRDELNAGLVNYLALHGQNVNQGEPSARALQLAEEDLHLLEEQVPDTPWGDLDPDTVDADTASK